RTIRSGKRVRSGGAGRRSGGGPAMSGTTTTAMSCWVLPPRPPSPLQATRRNEARIDEDVMRMDAPDRRAREYTETTGAGKPRARRQRRRAGPRRHRHVPPPLAARVGAPRPPHHPDGSATVRERRQQRRPGGADAGHRVEDLRQPEADAVVADDQREVGGAEV